MSVLVGGLVAVLGIGAAVGIVLAKGDGKDKPGSSQGAVATSVPRFTPGPVITLPPATQGPNPTANVPLPTTVVVLPTQAPATQDNGNGNTGGDTQTVSNDYESVTVPKAWESDKDETTVQVFPPEGGNLYLATGYDKTAVTATALLKDEVDWYKQNRTNVTICGEEKDYGLYNGPTGRSVTICYTAKNSSGSEYAAVLFLAIGTQAATDGGTLYFRMSVFAADEDWEAVVKAINPVLPSIQWKLYKGS
jgi:hypothetical protein